MQVEEKTSTAATLLFDAIKDRFSFHLIFFCNFCCCSWYFASDNIWFRFSWTHECVQCACACACNVEPYGKWMRLWKYNLWKFHWVHLKSIKILYNVHSWILVFLAISAMGLRSFTLPSRLSFLPCQRCSDSPSLSSCGRHALRWEQLKTTPNASIFNLFRFVGPKILIKGYHRQHHGECYIRIVRILHCVCVYVIGP